MHTIEHSLSDYFKHFTKCENIIKTKLSLYVCLASYKHRCIYTTKNTFSLVCAGLFYELYELCLLGCPPQSSCSTIGSLYLHLTNLFSWQHILTDNTRDVCNKPMSYIALCANWLQGTTHWYTVWFLCIFSHSHTDKCDEDKA